MDKDFEKKVKQKRIRTAAVVLVVLAAVVYLLMGTKVEKADYTDSLREQIEIAQSLYDENQDNIGNQKGQYTKACMEQFGKDIAAAQGVLDNKDSEYNDKKQAYETLKEQIADFKKAKNSSDLEVSSQGKTEDEAAETDSVEDPEGTETSTSDSGQSQSTSKEPAANDGAQQEQNTETKPETDKSPAADNGQSPSVSSQITVSLTIRCDTLAADLSTLRDASLAAYVPKDGIILSLPEVKVSKGESVYDVLDRVCRDKGIHMEAVYTPSYGADYIEGINYLYEFDAGEQSGWMYKVNGTFPNYGCSDYILEDGDSIVWAYTCDMGKDLGQQM